MWVQGTCTCEVCMRVWVGSVWEEVCMRVWVEVFLLGMYMY